eukprot:TRINITY_DN7696_c0_g2_i1.p1 TRINITY_DN7696_c0_g2~~TRINITY_DN7696_c0_g2_i1.p1  ORF type:complete len:220 (+),score=59.22 TRINITY_DN7696_c0_g2_i1:259-918(+)
MLNKLFGKQKDEGSSTLDTLDKLNEALETLEKRELLLQRKVILETEKAREATRAKNKKAAIQFLKRKKMFETQIEQLGNYQMRIHDQMIMLEGATATTTTVDALRSGASAMKAMQKSISMDDIDKTMDDISEQTDNMKQISDALATPFGASAEFDEDDLEAELLELEGADLTEESYPTPSTPIPTAPVPKLPAKDSPQKTAPESSGDEELEALQKEMAL